MPVKSIHSALLKWPDSETTLKKARSWAEALGRGNSLIAGIRCFGSIADGRWGIGSDLDILIEVRSSETPFERRSLGYPLPECDVPVDLVVYTAPELSRLRSEGSRFIREIERDSIVLYSAR